LFFFFQAEDGIRDIGVTGVQTCALPIYITAITAPTKLAPRLPFKTCGRILQIGRASCRERGVDLGGGRIIKKKKKSKIKYSTENKNNKQKDKRKNSNINTI